MEVAWSCSQGIWSAIADRCPAATFFHLPAWAELFQASGQGRYETLHVRWRDGRQAVVPIGLRKVWGGLVTVAEVGFGGGYGGILCDGPLSADECQDVYRLLKRRYRHLTLTSNPFDRTEPPDSGWQAQAPTRVLPAAPVETLRRGYAKDRRRLVRKCLERGVTLHWRRRPAPADMARFYGLYRQEVEHWRAIGRPLHWVRPESWFQHLRELAGDRLSLVVAKLDDQVVGAELLVHHGRVATELLVACDRRHLDLNVPSALAEASFAEAYALGCRYIDSMASGAMSGIDRFKASFGSEAWPVWSYHQVSRRARLLAAIQETAQRMGQLRVGLIPEAT